MLRLIFYFSHEKKISFMMIFLLLITWIRIRMNADADPGFGLQRMRIHITALRPPVKNKKLRNYR